jgi:transcriptional regulator with XRE-family HTH domain
MVGMSVTSIWTVGDRLRKARELAGLNHADMAEALGVSGASISRFERDSQLPRRGYLVAWSERTGMPLEWLQYGDTPPLPEVVAGSEKSSRSAKPRPKGPKRPRRNQQSTGWLTARPRLAA